MSTSSFSSERIFQAETQLFVNIFKSTFLSRQKELRAQIFTEVRSLLVFWKSDVDFSKSGVDFQNFGISRKKIENFERSKFCIFFFFFRFHFIRSQSRKI